MSHRQDRAHHKLAKRLTRNEIEILRVTKQCPRCARDTYRDLLFWRCKRCGWAIDAPGGELPPAPKAW